MYIIYMNSLITSCIWLTYDWHDCMSEMHSHVRGAWLFQMRDMTIYVTQRGAWLVDKCISYIYIFIYIYIYVLFIWIVRKRKESAWSHVAHMDESCRTYRFASRDAHVTFCVSLFWRHDSLETMCDMTLCGLYFIHMCDMTLCGTCDMTHPHAQRGGGLGSRPKKMYGERVGDGVEYHLKSPTPRR